LKRFALKPAIVGPVGVKVESATVIMSEAPTLSVKSAF
jgi:hypothetical protein